jgi:protein-S-isoprenylcysteine O-methyltransferase Ste14
VWRDTIIEFDEHGGVIAIGGEPWPAMKAPPTVTQRRRAPHLVSEPRKILRRYTFAALALVAVVQAGALLSGSVPPSWVQWLTLCVALAGVGGAFVDQPRAR